MMFFRKKSDNHVMSFIKEADKKVRPAFIANDATIASEVCTSDMMQSLRREISSRHAHDEQKFDTDKFMDSKYELVEETSDTAIVRRDVFFKSVKSGAHRFLTGIDFSEFITINKTNGFAISAIAAA